MKDNEKDPKTELGLSNYATEVDLKKSTDVHNSDFAKKTDFDHFKYDAYW